MHEEDGPLAWYTRNVVAPPVESLRALVATYARLRVALADAIGDPALVQPDGHFFPDAVAPDASGVARLFARMVSHSPLADDLPVELVFVADDEGHAGGCGSGACSAAPLRAGSHAVEDRGDRYRVSVRTSDLGDPALLITTLARATGALVLHEGGEADGEIDAATSEVCAVMCGFGVLVTSGSAVWVKGCGGLRGIQGTALSVEESAVALALFAALHRVSPGAVRRHLEPTQREAYDEAWEWVESNPLLLDALRRNPAWLEDGMFELEPTRGLLGRWLYRRRVARELRIPVATTKVSRSDAQRRYLEEAKALVEETVKT